MRRLTVVFIVICMTVAFWGCRGTPDQAGLDASEIQSVTGLKSEIISLEDIRKGKSPSGFSRKAKAEYKPSFNEDPAIPAQCWVETGYGTQNACKYCHTNYLAEIRHGNALALAEDQVLYSFPSPNLNRVNWKNIIHPEEILADNFVFLVFYKKYRPSSEILSAMSKVFIEAEEINRVGAEDPNTLP